MFGEVGHERKRCVIVIDSIHQDKSVHIHKCVVGTEAMREWLAVKLPDLGRERTTKTNQGSSVSLPWQPPVTMATDCQLTCSLQVS